MRQRLGDVGLRTVFLLLLLASVGSLSATEPQESDPQSAAHYMGRRLLPYYEGDGVILSVDGIGRFGVEMSGEMLSVITGVLSYREEDAVRIWRMSGILEKSGKLFLTEAIPGPDGICSAVVLGGDLSSEGEEITVKHLACWTWCGPEIAPGAINMRLLTHVSQEPRAEGEPPAQQEFVLRAEQKSND